ncbi:MAG TPA: hypothetical protein VFM79_00755 [Pelobium sp.]|nr:hypothetical protein [Pelobium sp.]
MICYLLLYHFTGEKKYLEQAEQLASDSFKFFSAASHKKNLSIAIDLPWFVTVLFRGYEALYKVDKNYEYLGAIEDYLNYAWENSRDEDGFITHSWLPKKEELDEPKWLLDESCISELYARLSQIKKVN